MLTGLEACGTINNVSGTPQQLSLVKRMGTIVGGFKNQNFTPMGDVDKKTRTW
jgi:hypothetical protein